MTALTVMTHINAVYDSFSCESWPTLSEIKTRRNADGMRQAFAIHDVGRSGNLGLRRGGDHAVRVLGRITTQPSSKFLLRIWLVKPTLSAHRNSAKLQTLPLVCPRIMSTDVTGLSGKIIAETDLMRKPPDHHAPGEAPKLQDDGGKPRHNNLYSCAH
jgi:hypothetical protein